MPATVQKTLDRTLENIHNKFNFLEDIIIIIKASPSDHDLDKDKILTRLENKTLPLKSKMRFRPIQYNLARTQNNSTGCHPSSKKTDSILHLKPPYTLKQLWPSFGLSTLINNVHPKSWKPTWTDSATVKKRKNTEQQNTVEWFAHKSTQKHYHKNFKNNSKSIFTHEKNMRLKCDAKHKSLGAVLKQQYL